MSPARAAPRRRSAADLSLARQGTLLDLLDHVLDKGVVLQGDLVISVADVELVYVRLSALLCGMSSLARRR